MNSPEIHLTKCEKGFSQLFIVTIYHFAMDSGKTTAIIVIICSWLLGYLLNLYEIQFSISHWEFGT